jgi:hypothetical protein
MFNPDFAFIFKMVVGAWCTACFLLITHGYSRHLDQSDMSDALRRDYFTQWSFSAVTLYSLVFLYCVHSTFAEGFGSGVSMLVALIVAFQALQTVLLLSFARLMDRVDPGNSSSTAETARCCFFGCIRVFLNWLAIYGLLWSGIAFWWLYAFAVVFFIGLMHSAVMRKFLPRWKGLKPVTDARLLEIVRRSKVRVSGIYWYNDGDRLGVGRGGLCDGGVIYIDEAVRSEYPGEAADFIMAHELGHSDHSDCFWQTFWDALIACIGLGLLCESSKYLGLDMSYAANFYVVYLCMFVFEAYLTLPLKMAFSRFQERRADSFAHELLQDTDGIAAFLAPDAGLNWRPCLLRRLVMTHPLAEERLARAQLWHDAKGAVKTSPIAA